MCMDKHNSNSMKKQPDEDAQRVLTHVELPDEVKIDSDRELTSPGQLVGIVQ